MKREIEARRGVGSRAGEQTIAKYRQSCGKIFSLKEAKLKETFCTFVANLAVDSVGDTATKVSIAAEFVDWHPLRDFQFAAAKRLHRNRCVER